MHKIRKKRIELTLKVIILVITIIIAVVSVPLIIWILVFKLSEYSTSMDYLLRLNILASALIMLINSAILVKTSLDAVYLKTYLESMLEIGDERKELGEAPIIEETKKLLNQVNEKINGINNNVNNMNNVIKNILNTFEIICDKTVGIVYEVSLSDIVRYIYSDVIKKGFIDDLNSILKNVDIDKKSLCNEVNKKLLELKSTTITLIPSSNILDLIAFIAQAEQCGIQQENVKELEEEIINSITNIIKEKNNKQKLINRVCIEIKQRLD